MTNIAFVFSIRYVNLSVPGKVRCIFIDPPYSPKSAIEHYDDKVEYS